MDRKGFSLIEKGIQEDLDKAMAKETAAIKAKYRGKKYVGPLKDQKKAMAADRAAEKAALEQKRAELKKKLEAKGFGPKGKDHYEKLVSKEGKAKSDFGKSASKGRAKTTFNQAADKKKDEAAKKKQQLADAKKDFNKAQVRKSKVKTPQKTVQKSNNQPQIKR